MCRHPIGRANVYLITPRQWPFQSPRDSGLEGFSHSTPSPLPSPPPLYPVASGLPLCPRVPLGGRYGHEVGHTHEDKGRGDKDIEGSAHRCMPSPRRKRIAAATSSAIISVPTRGRPLTVYHKSICTQSRDRTGTNLRPLVFETNASTYSAIWAHCETERKDSTNSRSPSRRALGTVASEGKVGRLR